MKAKNWILSFVTLAMGLSPAMAQQAMLDSQIIRTTSM